MNTPQKGFTLVELIVVIVILGVLATIGFVSYSGYLGGARDGNRITQLKNINGSLNLYGATKTLPLPDDYVSITASGTTVGYQGYAGKNVLELINYISGGQDPKDGTYYTYYLTKDRKNLQLMALLEESGGLQTHNTISNPLIPQTYAADYSNRFPKTYGKKLGILVSNATATKNTPAQEMTTTDIDLATTTDYTAYIDDTNNIESSTAGDLLTTIPNGSCNRIKQTGGSKGNGTYKINPDGTGDIEVYCDMENGGGGWTHIGSKISGGTQAMQGLGVLKTKPGTPGNISIGQDSLRNSLTEAMACSNSNCWVWDINSAFKNCLENSCNTVTSQSVSVKRISGTTGFQTITATSFRYNWDTANPSSAMFQIDNGSSGLGATTGRWNMDGSGYNASWSDGDQWNIYVR